MTTHLVKEKPLVGIKELEEEEVKLEASKIKKGVYKGKPAKFKEGRPERPDLNKRIDYLKRLRSILDVEIRELEAVLQNKHLPKAVRERLGMTQVAFAKMLGVNLTSLWKWEKFYTPALIHRVCTILDEDLDYLHADTSCFDNSHYIKQLREKLNMSRRQFAHLIGATENTIYVWEIGKTKPNKWYKILMVYYRDKLLEEQ
ncbi:MAG: helix-turn-helix domain-containing protein [Deltaproteobacteria bacterium]|nr:helix-turn-helix domain-containing protein [Deltaproteobacteria bacterium]MBW2309367.1 helix-turn-helix domain-containing protein [Deltaproteobacteria bacterium]